jgi:hypothetical protein
MEQENPIIIGFAIQKLQSEVTAVLPKNRDALAKNHRIQLDEQSINKAMLEQMLGKLTTTT